MSNGDVLGTLLSTLNADHASVISRLQKTDESRSLISGAHESDSDTCFECYETFRCRHVRLLYLSKHPRSTVYYYQLHTGCLEVERFILNGSDNSLLCIFGTGLKANTF